MFEPVEVVTIVGKDGRITIPAKLREALDIKESDVLKMFYTPNGNGTLNFQVLVIKK